MVLAVVLDPVGRVVDSLRGDYKPDLNSLSRLVRVSQASWHSPYSGAPTRLLEVTLLLLIQLLFLCSPCAMCLICERTLDFSLRLPYCPRLTHRSLVNTSLHL